MADPTRRGILEQLARGTATVGQLRAPFGLAPATMSKHIAVLERAGLIRRTREGRHLRSRLEPRPLQAGLDWMSEVRTLWEDQLDALEALLKRQRARGRG